MNIFRDFFNFVPYLEPQSVTKKVRKIADIREDGSMTTNTETCVDRCTVAINSYLCKGATQRHFLDKLHGNLCNFASF